METIYLLEGARTAFGSFGGSLKDIDATTLGVHASKEAIKRSGITAEEVDVTFFGHVLHSSNNAPYLARHVALHSGVPVERPALSVNRLCGSGMQAIISATQSLMLGEGRVALTGGTENMSLAPHVLRGSRFGTKLGTPKVDDMLWAGLTDEYIGAGMGMTAENLAEKYDITREEQDAFALRSHQLATRAQKEGKFKEEIVPLEILTRRGKQVVAEDEHIRPETSLEKLSSLRPAFKEKGTVTGGNASGINDGAAANIIATESLVKEKDLTPIARIVSWGIAGVDPNYMGIGPVPAMKQALEKAQLNLEDMALIEVNEAFAAQYLAVEKILGIDREKANVNGGAIALGHPLGASGARVVYTLVKELQRRKEKYGIASLCIGGGQGIALIVEAL